MRNNRNSRIHTIYEVVKNLPAFTLADISPIEQDTTYLKILLGRYAKKGKLVRLKRGLYVAPEYIDRLEKTQRFNGYKSFLANLLYEPSYLSLEYMLFEYHLLTEMPVHYTSISTRKTQTFQNAFGQFNYHSIKSGLFHGFTKKMIGGFSVQQATKAKALFDFLYLRQHLLFDATAIDALRINTDQLTQKDKKEFRSFIKQAQSKHLQDIGKYMIEN
ncbi:MAG: hypothetical protein HYV32_01575 [Candidatus Kerfeldbacteria bacterium]|nr:hypothetical protein [Candidatus Kerfeldbacteria bacterium]